LLAAFAGLVKVLGTADEHTNAVGLAALVAVLLGVLFYVGCVLGLRSSEWARSVWDGLGVVPSLWSRQALGRRRAATAEDVLRGRAATEQISADRERAAAVAAESERRRAAEVADRATDAQISSLAGAVLSAYKARKFNVPGGELLRRRRDWSRPGTRAGSSEIAGWQLFKTPVQVVNSDRRTDVIYWHAQRTVWWLLSSKEFGTTIECSASVMDDRKYQLRGAELNPTRDVTVVDLREIDADDKGEIIRALQRLTEHS